MTATDEAGCLTIDGDDDIVTARMMIRQTANDLGFGITDTTRIVTAVSELARNIHLYADSGTMRWQTRQDGERALLEIVFDDDGPGIDDVEKALQSGQSSADGMGQGLPGAKKLMDEFDLETSPDDGTTVTIRKYLQSGGLE
jgi:serine/threonine-protein kinase RsbT